MKLGIAWYREDQWELLKSTASDSKAIEDTHQEWLKNVGRLFKKLKKEGYEPVEVDLDVNKFNDWCQINNKAHNGKSRSEYTAYLLKIKSKSDG